MSAQAGTRQRPPVEQLNDAEVRALTEYLTVLPDYDRARGADELFVVVSHSGSEYLVDARGGACECPDAQYRDRTCKHLWRVRYATGRDVIPGWVDVEKINSTLGQHVAGEPRIMTASGRPVPLCEVRR